MDEATRNIYTKFAQFFIRNAPVSPALFLLVCFEPLVFS